MTKTHTKAVEISKRRASNVASERMKRRSSPSKSPVMTGTIAAASGPKLSMASPVRSQASDVSFLGQVPGPYNMSVPLFITPGGRSDQMKLGISLANPPT